MMFLHILYPYIKFIIGTLYPSYKTWKALKRKDETTRRHWMKYWVNFGAFQTMEIFTDFTLAYILPFYTEIKALAILWMVMGTKLLFDSIVNRELARREKTIDRWLTKISKCRNEILAIIWLELSQCSFKVLTAIMTGGLSVLMVNGKEDHQDFRIRSESQCSNESQISEEPMIIEEVTTSEDRPSTRRERHVSVDPITSHN